MRICLVSFTIKDAFFTPLTNLLKIMQSLSDSLYCLIGIYNSTAISELDLEKNPVMVLYHKPENFLFLRIFRYISIHIKITFLLLKVHKNFDMYVFFKEDQSFLSMLVLKLFKKKIIWVLPSQISLIFDNNSFFFHRLFSYIRNLCFGLSDKIVVYSPALIADWKLLKFKNKINIAHEQFINTDKFNISIPFSHRKKSVAYIGRLSEEKGILNFISAIPNVLKIDNEIIFRIAGNGELSTNIEQFLCKNRLQKKVELSGWISHDDLPEYINEIKLLVIPSFTEGLPNIMLEAMACGTIVLANPVGAIPDYIKDCETGFILENNSFECIAQNIVRIFNYNALESIITNAHCLVEEEFSFKKAVDGYSNILSSI